MDKVERFGEIAHKVAEGVGWQLDQLYFFYSDIPQCILDGATKRLKEFEEMIVSDSFDKDKAMSLLEGMAIEGMTGLHYLISGRNNYVSKTANTMTDLYARKNADYGDSFDKSMDKFGMVVSAIRIGDKVNRLSSLVTRRQEAQVKDESIADTFLDLACYAIMTMVWVLEKDKLSKENLIL